METLVKKSNGKATLQAVTELKNNGLSQLKEVIEHAQKQEPEPQAAQTEAPAPVPEVVEIPEPPKPTLTLEQKIEKVANLKTLIEKRERLEESRKKLTSFVIGTNQFNENIILTDENGNTFKTSNSEVFAKVVEAINSTLVSKIREIETQIEF